VSTKDGKLLWKKGSTFKKHRLHRDGSFASSSPAVDADRVYVNWMEPDSIAVIAFTHDGKEVWKKNLGPYRSFFGGGMSPIVYDGMVILNNDQRLESFLIALDAKTGTTRWKTPRKTEIVPYSTPVVYTSPNDKDQLIFTSTLHGLSGVDPKTGKVLWNAGGPIKSGLRPVASVVIAGDIIIATLGRGGGGKQGFGVTPGSTDGKIKPKVVYKLVHPIHYTPTPVVAGKFVFTCGDRGEMQCLDSATGKAIWVHREKEGFYSSPVLIGERIYWTTKKGTMIVTAAGKEYKELGRVSLGEKSFATPAIVGGVMYIRTFSQLLALGEKAQDL